MSIIDNADNVLDLQELEELAEENKLNVDDEDCDADNGCQQDLDKLCSGSFVAGLLGLKSVPHIKHLEIIHQVIFRFLDHVIVELFQRVEGSRWLSLRVFRCILHIQPVKKRVSLSEVRMQLESISNICQEPFSQRQVLMPNLHLSEWLGALLLIEVESKVDSRLVTFLKVDDVIDVEWQPHFVCAPYIDIFPISTNNSTLQLLLRQVLLQADVHLEDHVTERQAQVHVVSNTHKFGRFQ